MNVSSPDVWLTGMSGIIYVGLAESCDISREDLDSPMVPICQNKFQASFQFVLIAELSLQLFSPSQTNFKLLPGHFKQDSEAMKCYQYAVVAS